MKKPFGSLITAGLSVMLLSGCGPVSTNAVSSISTPSQASATSAQLPSPAPTVSTSPTVAATALPVALKPVAAHVATGGIVINTVGAIMPNLVRTPGALNPSVTQATIGRTICVTGWTATIRPPSSDTTRLKIAQLASGYAYKGDKATGDYEEDHLISLELGGAPSAEANLWPEPYSGAEGARVKDRIENKLHSLVCSHSITLAAAQRVIATNWWTAYQTYVGATNATVTHKASSASAPKPASAPRPVAKPAPAVAPGEGATALCNDGTYSYAAHHQGACSRHHGVTVFYK